MGRLFLLLCLAAVLTGSGMARAGTATEAIDRVWTTYTQTPEWTPDKTEKFTKMCKSMADVHGAALIDPIMARSKDWKGEEVLIFAPVVIFIPREASVPILKRYQKFGKPSERQCATDLLIEMDSPDAKQMLEKEGKP